MRAVCVCHGHGQHRSRTTIDDVIVPHARTVHTRAAELDSKERSFFFDKEHIKDDDECWSDCFFCAIFVLCWKKAANNCVCYLLKHKKVNHRSCPSIHPSNPILSSQ